MNTKKPIFLEKYPKSEPICSYLHEQIGRSGYSDTELSHAINISRKNLSAYLDYGQEPLEIPVGFIESIYNLTHFDTEELNRIAQAPDGESSQTKPAPKPCVKLDRKAINFLKNTIEREAADPHNHQFLNDVKNIFQLPPDTCKQIQAKVHDIVTQCMSSPNHALLQSERLLGFYDRYVDSLPNEQDQELIGQGQNATGNEDKKALKSNAKKRQLMEEAQRAHFVNRDYQTAKKTYVKIIQKYHKADKYYMYISCLNLLALNYSPLTKRNLSFGETLIEKRITDLLNDTTVWEEICEIFDRALLSSNGNLKRVRTGRVGDTYDQSKE